MIKYLKRLIRKWLGEPESIFRDTPYFLVNRHYLSSINPEDGDEYLKDLTEQERREYEAEASMVASSKVFQKELKHLFSLQAFFVANESQNWEQTLIGRGTVNGIGLIEERFKLLYARHLDNIKKPTEDELSTLI